MMFGSKDCVSAGIGEGEGVGVGVVKGEGPGVGLGDGVSEGIGEGVGVTCWDTFQIHVRETVPFLLDAIAEMFHVPTAGLAFV